MTIISPYTYADTIGNNAPTWLLRISGWGNRGASSVAGDLAYSGSIPGGVQGVAIGPDSTVNEAIIGFNLVGPTSASEVAPTPGQVGNFALTVGGGSPLGPLPGPLSVRVAMQGQYGDAYFPDDSATTAPFGAVAGAIFENPELQLIFYGPRAKMVLPGRRSPMLRQVSTAFTSETTKTAVQFWPVMGRGAKRLVARATGTLAGNVNFGLINYMVTTQAPATAVSWSDEVQTANIAVDGATGAVAEFDSSVPCQFVAVYFTRSSGSGNITAMLTAIDPPV